MVVLGKVLGAGAIAAAALAFAEPSLAGSDSYNWTGAYVGGQVGGAWGSSPFDYLYNTDNAGVVVNTSPRVVGPEVDFSGVVGGLHAGYLYDMKGLVLGVEGTYDWGNLSGSATAAFANLAKGGPDLNNPVVGHVGIKSFGTLDAKIGVANGNWLAYADNAT